MLERFQFTSEFADRHGQMRWRFRKKGMPSHYFDSPFGTQEFADEWAGCLTGESQAAKTDRKTKPECPASDAPIAYFVGADHGPIKIGHTRNLAARIETIQWGYPYKVDVLAVAPGGQATEAAYHKRFFRHRLNREWFERAPEIVAEIARLRGEMANL